MPTTIWFLKTVLPLEQFKIYLYFFINIVMTTFKNQLLNPCELLHITD